MIDWIIAHSHNLIVIMSSILLGISEILGLSSNPNSSKGIIDALIKFLDKFKGPPALP